MLVLMRRVGEIIVLPEKNITIQLMGVKGRRVQLGIAAPDDVTICRVDFLPAHSFEERETGDETQGERVHNDSAES